MALKLHSYQEKAVEFALEHKQVYLAMDLGTGKTASVITLLNQIQEPAIVFAPVRVCMTTWPDELDKWDYYGSYGVVHTDWGLGKDEVILANPDLILIPYSSLKWFFDNLHRLSKQGLKWRKRALILDESSMVKSSKSNRFKMLRKMDFMWTDTKLCLGATPRPNSLLELWTQYFILDKGKSLLPTITKFRDGYCSSFSRPGQSYVTYNVRPDMVDNVHAAVAPITYHIDAKDVLDMPPITYNQIRVELPAALRADYQELEETFFLELENSERAGAVNAAALSGKLRQFVQGGIYYYPEGVTEEIKNRKWKKLHGVKLNALKELVETSAGHPILCAIQFKFELEILREVYPSAPVIAGGTPPKQALECIRMWNLGQVPLLLCHPASLSHGVNLQSGGHILLYYGLPWSFEQYSQLVGRLYRQGQDHAVFVHHIVMADTIDEAILDAQAGKADGHKSLLSYVKEYHRDRLKLNP